MFKDSNDSVARQSVEVAAGAEELFEAWLRERHAAADELLFPEALEALTACAGVLQSCMIRYASDRIIRIFE